jgi:hypothetical protein
MNNAYFELPFDTTQGAQTSTPKDAQLLVDMSRHVQ